MKSNIISEYGDLIDIIKKLTKYFISRLLNKPKDDDDDDDDDDDEWIFIFFENHMKPILNAIIDERQIFNIDINIISTIESIKKGELVGEIRITPSIGKDEIIIKFELTF